MINDVLHHISIISGLLTRGSSRLHHFILIHYVARDSWGLSQDVTLNLAYLIESSQDVTLD